jgi:hypothetical protein
LGEAFHAVEAIVASQLPGCSGGCAVTDHAVGFEDVNFLRGQAEQIFQDLAIVLPEGGRSAPVKS